MRVHRNAKAKAPIKPTDIKMADKVAYLFMAIRGTVRGTVSDNDADPRVWVSLGHAALAGP